MTVSTTPRAPTRRRASDDLIDLCRAAMREEAQALTTYAASMGAEFGAALRVLHDAKDPVVVAGIGKSGHVARKIAATFLSIGRPPSSCMPPRRAMAISA